MDTLLENGIQPPAATAATVQFTTRGGQVVPFCSFSEWAQRNQRITQDDHISALQVAEGCGYSLAMVVRFALGHSADRGVVTAFASDTLCGWIVAAASRHLLNAGAHVKVVLPNQAVSFSPALTQLLTPLDTRGAQLFGWNNPEWGELTAVVESSHNVLCGFADATTIDPNFHNSFAEQMNESSIPVHSVALPVGASTAAIKGVHQQLFASSTMSLGLPIRCLEEKTDLVGRHYLCDAGWSLNDYQELGLTGPSLFAEQPVVQLVLPE